MGVYRKKRKLSLDMFVFELKKRIPELKDINSYHLEHHLKGSDLIFYKEDKTKVPFLIRITLPFALITWLLMFISLPFKFILTGNWGYDHDWSYNWFKSLKLL